jgi:hypothetical protein
MGFNRLMGLDGMGVVRVWVGDGKRGGVGIGVGPGNL